jgi:hypothetical protein
MLCLKAFSLLDRDDAPVLLFGPVVGVDATCDRGAIVDVA